jgi:hypothetical protein
MPESGAVAIWSTRMVNEPRYTVEARRVISRVIFANCAYRATIYPEMTPVRAANGASSLVSSSADAPARLLLVIDVSQLLAPAVLHNEGSTHVLVDQGARAYPEGFRRWNVGGDPPRASLV